MENKEEKKLTRKEVKNQLTEIIKLFHKPSEIKSKEKESSLEELINYIRVSVKYFLLDIDALKRENKHLIKLLEKENK